MNREDQHRSQPEGRERDVTSLVRDIRRLGRRLVSPAALNDPQVKSALLQLDRLVATALGTSHGRHRVQGAGAEVLTRPEPVRDAWGYDLKPNPLEATTSAEFVNALRDYRVWAGKPSFRLMAARAQQFVAHSTMCVALNSSDLPALKVVTAIVVGCGGGSEDQEKFVTAWRRINSGDFGSSGIQLQP